MENKEYCQLVKKTAFMLSTQKLVKHIERLDAVFNFILGFVCCLLLFILCSSYFIEPYENKIKELETQIEQVKSGAK